MKLLHLTLIAFLLTAGLSSTANAFKLSAGGLAAPLALDSVRCIVTHSHPTKAAFFDVKIYNHNGTQVGSNVCDLSDNITFGRRCGASTDPTNTSFLCVVEGKKVPAKTVRGALCAYENGTSNPLACVPLTK